jgi:hypothetical protein
MGVEWESVLARRWLWVDNPTFRLGQPKAKILGIHVNRSPKVRTRRFVSRLSDDHLSLRPQVGGSVGQPQTISPQKSR